MPWKSGAWKSREGKRRSAVNIKIRLVKRGRKPTRAEVMQVIDEIIESKTVPDDWEFHAIDWDHGGSKQYHGDEFDVEKFAPVLYAMKAQLQTAIVRSL